jgi:hypothetical protein
MSEPIHQASELGGLVDTDALRDWMSEQRWYASKSRGLAGVELMDAAALGEQLFLALVQTRLATGTHELYQLLLHTRGGSEDSDDPERGITTSSGLRVYPALQEPESALLLLRNLLADADIFTEGGRFSFRHIEGAYVPGENPSVRAMGAQQSNSTLVVDERVALKLFRKLESGINPELEMLRFLTARDFEHIAGLQGWYEYEGSSLASTLGVAQDFVPESRDGWELALDEIMAAPESFLARLDELGRVTARLHTTLASDSGDPAFSPEDPTSESMSLLTASIDEDIERIFMRLPDIDSVATIRGRGEDVRAKLADRSRISSGGKQIRIHGDYHLGQTLETPGDRCRIAGTSARRCATWPECCGRSRTRPRRSSCSGAGRRRKGSRNPRAKRSSRHTWMRSIRRCCQRARRRSATCSRSSSSKRPSMSSVTSSTTVPIGSRSRSRGSGGCWTTHEQGGKAQYRRVRRNRRPRALRPALDPRCTQEARRCRDRPGAEARR